MSVRNLQHLFAPASVALIGASQRAGSVGATVLRNLAGAGFKGAIYPVNPKYRVLAGLRCYAAVVDLPQAPALALICTPPATVPGNIKQLGERGCRAAIILSAGLSRLHDASGRSLQQGALDGRTCCACWDRIASACWCPPSA